MYELAGSRTRRAGLQVASLLGLCSTLGACTGAADIPATPDLTSLQRQFENPTAELDETQAGQALNEMPNLHQLAAGFRAAGFTTDGVNDADDEASANVGSRFRVQGSIKVTIRCPGELDVPSFGQNGTVNLTLGVQENLIKRGIAMTANDCVLRGTALGTPVRVAIDGPMYMDLGRDLGLRQRWSGRLLMLIAGKIEIGGLELENLAARWTDDQLEYLFRLPEDENSWVVAVVTADGTISVKSKGTTYGCSDGQACGSL